VPPQRAKRTSFLPDEIYDAITDARIKDPTVPLQMAKKRSKRHAIAEDGRLSLLAADHPARMVTAIRDDAVRMGNRHEFLSRILRVIACSEFDGILSTSDIVDELFFIEQLASGNATKFLDQKVIVGSMNRGGLAGSAFELDDTVTGYDVEGLVAMNLDAGKFLLRLDPGDRDSGKTLEYCVDTIRKCNEKDLPIFVEPLPVSSGEGVKVERNAEKLIKLVGVATALSSSSTKIWLKLPFCEDFEDVARSTTLPILLLGGEATNDIESLLTEVETALRSGPNVRGVLMGRSLLYPPVGDPFPLANAVNAMVHRGLGAKQALVEMKKWEGVIVDPFRTGS